VLAVAFSTFFTVYQTWQALVVSQFEFLVLLTRLCSR